MANEAEIRAAAMALWELMTPPGELRSDWEKWLVPAARALEAAEKYRDRTEPPIPTEQLRDYINKL